MNRPRWALVCGLALALVAGRGQTADDDAETIKAARELQPALKKLIDAVAKGGDGKKEAEAIKKQLPDDLKPAMWGAFKPSDKAGIGLGTGGTSDGVEQRIMTLYRQKDIKDAELPRLKADLERIAAVAQAMTEVARLYPRTRDQDKWVRYNDEMREGVDELRKALRSGTGKAVKKAVNNLYSSCTGCHGEFR